MAQETKEDRRLTTQEHLKAKIIRQRKVLKRMTDNRKREREEHAQKLGALEKQKDYWHEMYRKVKPIRTH